MLVLQRRGVGGGGGGAGDGRFAEGLLLLDVVGEVAEGLSYPQSVYRPLPADELAHTDSPALRSCADCGACLYRSCLVAMMEAVDQ